MRATSARVPNPMIQLGLAGGGTGPYALKMMDFERHQSGMRAASVCVSRGEGAPHSPVSAAQDLLFPFFFRRIDGPASLTGVPAR